jgi:hypothetical protein
VERLSRNYKALSLNPRREGGKEGRKES